MKKIFTLSAPLVLSLIVRAQNLVPNPSFENYLACPGGFGQLSDNAFNWQAWGNTNEYPNYFHTCVGEWGSSVPQNGFGHQEPVSGEGYAGMLTFGKNYPQTQIHIGCQLNQSLELGSRIMFRITLTVLGCGRSL